MRHPWSISRLLTAALPALLLCSSQAFGSDCREGEALLADARAFGTDVVNLQEGASLLRRCIEDGRGDWRAQLALAWTYYELRDYTAVTRTLAALRDSLSGQEKALAEARAVMLEVRLQERLNTLEPEEAGLRLENALAVLRTSGEAREYLTMSVYREFLRYQLERRKQPDTQKARHLLETARRHLEAIVDGTSTAELTGTAVPARDRAKPAALRALRPFEMEAVVHALNHLQNIAFYESGQAAPLPSPVCRAGEADRNPLACADRAVALARQAGMPELFAEMERQWTSHALKLDQHGSYSRAVRYLVSRVAAPAETPRERDELEKAKIKLTEQLLFNDSRFGELATALAPLFDGKVPSREQAMRRSYAWLSEAGQPPTRYVELSRDILRLNVSLWLANNAKDIAEQGRMRQEVSRLHRKLEPIVPEVEEGDAVYALYLHLGLQQPGLALSWFNDPQVRANPWARKLEQPTREMLKP